MPDLPSSPGGDETGRLVAAARDGDQEAWRRLYERFRALLAFQAQSGIPDHLRGRFDSEDVLQSVFLSAFQALPDHEYRGEPAFRAWLKEITRHELTSRIRAQLASKRSPEREQSGGDLDKVSGGNDETPSQVFSRVEHRARVLDALKQLEDAHLEVLWMRDFEHRPWEEIARVLGCAASSARRRHRTALEALVRRLR